MDDTLVDGRIILKIIFEKQCVKVWNGLNWFRMRSSGGLL
jgi:hypothetical protein